MTYNIDALSSKTINGFLNSKLSFHDVNLVVWNNGPQLYNSFDLSALNRKGITVFLHQTIENKPLSYVYNEFISHYRSDYYVILDHDSSVTDLYLESVIRFDEDVGVPAISVNGKHVSPAINGVFSQGPYTSKQRLIAIGSGIVFSNNIVSLLNIKYGNVFDSAFALYGIDTSFFLRLFQLQLIDKARMLPGFSHSLSRLVSESKEQTNFRNKERSYDVGITLRRYFSLFQLWYTIKILIKILIGKSKFRPWIIIKSFFSGIHPRCKLMK